MRIDGQDIDKSKPASDKQHRPASLPLELRARAAAFLPWDEFNNLLLNRNRSEANYYLAAYFNIGIEDLDKLRAAMALSPQVKKALTNRIITFDYALEMLNKKSQITSSELRAAWLNIFISTENALKAQAIINTSNKPISLARVELGAILKIEKFDALLRIPFVPNGPENNSDPLAIFLLRNENLLNQRLQAILSISKTVVGAYLLATGFLTPENLTRLEQRLRGIPGSTLRTFLAELCKCPIQVVISLIQKKQFSLDVFIDMQFPANYRAEDVAFILFKLCNPKLLSDLSQSTHTLNDAKELLCLFSNESNFDRLRLENIFPALDFAGLRPLTEYHETYGDRLLAEFINETLNIQENPHLIPQSFFQFILNMQPDYLNQLIYSCAILGVYLKTKKLEEIASVIDKLDKRKISKLLIPRFIPDLFIDLTESQSTVVLNKLIDDSFTFDIESKHDLEKLLTYFLTNKSRDLTERVIKLISQQSLERLFSKENIESIFTNLFRLRNIDRSALSILAERIDIKKLLECKIKVNIGEGRTRVSFLLELLPISRERFSAITVIQILDAIKVDPNIFTLLIFLKINPNLLRSVITELHTRNHDKLILAALYDGNVNYWGYLDLETQKHVLDLLLKIRQYDILLDALRWDKADSNLKLEYIEQLIQSGYFSDPTRMFSFLYTLLEFELMKNGLYELAIQKRQGVPFIFSLNEKLNHDSANSYWQENNLVFKKEVTQAVKLFRKHYLENRGSFMNLFGISSEFYANFEKLKNDLERYKYMHEHYLHARTQRKLASRTRDIFEYLDTLSRPLAIEQPAPSAG